MTWIYVVAVASFGAGFILRALIEADGREVIIARSKAEKAFLEDELRAARLHAMACPLAAGAAEGKSMAQWADAELAAEARREAQARMGSYDTMVLEGRMTAQAARDRIDKMLAIVARLEMLANLPDHLIGAIVDGLRADPLNPRQVIANALIGGLPAPPWR
jgi:hypothetical protein